MTHEAPRLRQSLAKLLLSECPAVCKLALDGERRSGTKAMRRGSLVDQLVFGGAQYEVVDATYKTGPRKGQVATDWTGTAARAQKDEIEARGYVACLPDELEQAQELAGRIRAELILAGIEMRECRLQPTYEWTTPLGVAARGTPDCVLGNGDTLDLKVGDSANPRFIARQVHAMYWDLQAAVYQEAVRSTDVRPGQHWICRADPKTKLIGLYPLSETYMLLGLRRWEEAQRKWQECLTSGEWPGYSREAIEPPRWAIGETTGYDNDLSDLGLDFEGIT